MMSVRCAASRAWGQLVARTGPAAAAPAAFRLFSTPAAPETSASASPGPRKARPMPEPAEVRRQRVAYKQQVHELRLQYAKELQAKESKLQELRKAAASATARDDAGAREQRAQRAQAKKARLQERTAEFQRAKAERMEAGHVSQKAATEKREEKYLGKFTTMALEAKTWAASQDAVDSLIQDALIDVKKPQFRMPQRPAQRRG